MDEHMGKLYSFFEDAWYGIKEVVVDILPALTFACSFITLLVVINK